MADPTRGITDPDMRRVVREALAQGWEWCGMSGTTHAVIRWPDTGDRLTFGCTPRVASWKSLATDITKVSGCEVWRKGNRKASRKAVRASGFDFAEHYENNRRWSQAYGPRVEQLHTERADAIDRARELAKDRARLRDIPPLLAKIKHLEKLLTVDYHQACEPFDPFTLAPPAPPRRRSC